jgi:excisionase family DNA binding protein
MEGGSEGSANVQNSWSQPFPDNGEQPRIDPPVGWTSDGMRSPVADRSAEDPSASVLVPAATALLLTIEEVAGLLRLDARSVAELITSRALRTIEISGLVRVPRASVDRLIAGLLRRDQPPGK